MTTVSVPIPSPDIACTELCGQAAISWAGGWCWRGPGVVECETEQRPVLSAAAAPLQLVGYYNAVVQIYKVRMIDGDRFKPMFRFCPSFRDETMNLLVTVFVCLVQAPGRWS